MRKNAKDDSPKHASVVRGDSVLAMLMLSPGAAPQNIGVTCNGDGDKRTNCNVFLRATLVWPNG